MKYDISEQMNCVVIRLKGRVIGGPQADEFREKLHDFIEEGNLQVIVSLKNVEFINSLGLGMLVGSLTTMRNAGGNLVICGADQMIENMLSVTRLITVFQHFQTVEKALESYQDG